MASMTIADAAEYLGISREAIHNRIRRGSLEVSLIEGVKYVDVNVTSKSISPAKVKKAPTKIVSTQNAQERYYKLLEEQNAQLQVKVEKLEGETRTLRDQKEDMLIQERIKIEQIYKDKDEQLKNLLHTISSQFMLHAPLVTQEEHLDAELEEVAEVIESVEEEKATLISLKKHLKKHEYSQSKQVKIKARFTKKAKKDDRIIVVGNKVYINIAKYDYSDLIK